MSHTVTFQLTSPKTTSLKYTLTRLPSKLSTIPVIRNRYGNDTVKLVRKFEKRDYKDRKLLLDLISLES